MRFEMKLKLSCNCRFIRLRYPPYVIVLACGLIGIEWNSTQTKISEVTLEGYQEKRTVQLTFVYVRAPLVTHSMQHIPLIDNELDIETVSQKYLS